MSDHTTPAPRQQFLVFVLAFAAVFLLRSLYTMPPEMHDARKKWHVASEIAESGDLSYLLEVDHHSSRWGINLPAAAAIKVFGKNLITYYALVLTLCALIFAVLISQIRREIPPALVVLFCVLLFYEPMFFRASTQLQPFAFGLACVVLGIWFAGRYIQSRHPLPLLACALMGFCAYGVKESYLFFSTGVMLLLWMRAGFRSAVTCGALMFFLFLLETLAFNLMSGQLVFGRIELLAEGKHLEKMPGRERYDLVQYLTRRWLLLPAYDKVIAFGGFAFSAWVAASGRFRSLTLFSQGIILVTVSYSLLVTTFPMSIDPLIPIQPLKVKYLTPVMPLLVYLFALGVGHLVSRLGENACRAAGVLLMSAALAFLAYSLAFESPFTYRHHKKDYPRKHAMLWKYQHVTRDLESGIGVCGDSLMAIVRVQNMIRNYMNEDGIIEELEQTEVDAIRYLHHHDYDVSELTGFLSYRDLDRPIAREDCP